MKNPDFYDEFSEGQRKDAADLIPHIVTHMHWKPNERILDFGCGSGFVTRNVLLPNLEKSYSDQGRRVIGVDISQKMVEFASAKYRHPHVTYMTGDIMMDGFEFPCKFDKIFSFYVLHWIPDLRKCLQTLHSLMKPNGEIGFFFLINAFVYSVYDAMSKNPVWALYFQDVQNFIPKTFYSSDARADMRLMMTSIGFCIQESTVSSRSAYFRSVDELLDNVLAFNPFIERIPTEMQAAYRS